MQALIVEDDEALQIFYEQLLTHSGYAVAHAYNTREALDILEQTYPLPELILLDMRMPGGNGFPVLDYIEAHPQGEHTHVAVITAGSEFEAAVREYAIASFHLKPIRYKEVLEIAEAAKQRQ